MTWSLAAWIALTVVTQHPLREFDGPRRKKSLRMVLPDWRFFVPNPATEDLVPLYRSVVDGEAGGWRRLYPPRTPRWWHLLVNPDGRRDHAAIDVCRELTMLGVLDATQARECVPLTLLRDAVARQMGQGATTVQIAVAAEAPFASPPRRHLVWLSPILDARR
ncbi:hypothetical protein ASF87_03445 [Microbacterium sp. Leaf161]|uniref:hypothetical protein n=1 Tax=Microbacterium sp. Leaf161 TaxID=1736281 RepID=UPI0006FC5877|nr:hypothetical protein [Microbacterium sp. Leaf161]KQR48008.1 hypothetical protein ASF87_03445 [Microbacterium sp. Leaf161]